MQWARYGTEKRNISAAYYREEKHGEVYCKFCNGKMAFVKTGNRSPHFRVIDRKTHTCKYFGNDIEDIVASCSAAVQLDRKNNESPVFKLNMDYNKKGSDTNENGESQLSEDLSLLNISFHPYIKEKILFKFVFDIYEAYLKNENDRVLQFRFVLLESGESRKIKADDLVPSYKNILLLNAKEKLSERKRFIVGSILSSKETVKKHIEVTLRGVKLESGHYINHKIIFMKNVLDNMGLKVEDFYKNRSIIIYSKLKLNENEREVISFVSSVEDFDFGRYTSLDGDWVNTNEQKEIDDFLYTRNILHTIPTPSMAKLFFQQEERVWVPGWVIFLNEKPVVVDYADSPNDLFQGTLELKRKYFLERSDCMYINIYKDDLTENYSGLKKKIHTIQPNLQLNFFES